MSQRASDATPGTVVDQAPPPGSAWTRGDRVGLTLAAGRTVAVPDDAGYALDAATELIAGMGLALGKTSTTSEPATPTRRPSGWKAKSFAPPFGLGTAPTSRPFVAS